MQRFMRILIHRTAALAAVMVSFVFIHSTPLFALNATLKLGEYFDEVLVNKPAGVYENGDRIFVLARVPQEESPVRSKAAASVALTQELRKWAVAKSNEISPKFPKEPGLITVYQLYRKYFVNENKSWIWHNSGTAQSFHNDDGEEYIFALCIKKKDILDSLPIPGIGDGLPNNWRDYICAITRQRYVRAEDLGFLLDCGVPDAVLARETVLVSKTFDNASATNFLQLVEKFLVSETNRNPFGKAFASEKSFEAIQRLLAVNLPKTWVAESIQKRVAAFTTSMVASSNIVSTVVTNATDFLSNKTVAMIESHSTTNVAPPILVAEKMFLTAGRFVCATDLSVEASILAQEAFKVRGGLTKKREKLWTLLCDKPGIPDAWNYLGRILREEGLFSSAIACFRCAIRLQPAHEFAWANLMLTYNSLGKLDLAISTAIIARGLALDSWSIRETEAFLLKPEGVCP